MPAVHLKKQPTPQQTSTLHSWPRMQLTACRSRSAIGRATIRTTPGHYTWGVDCRWNWSLFEECETSYTFFSSHCRRARRRWSSWQCPESHRSCALVKSSNSRSGGCAPTEKEVLSVRPNKQQTTKSNAALFLLAISYHDNLQAPGAWLGPLSSAGPQAVVWHHHPLVGSQINLSGGKYNERCYNSRETMKNSGEWSKLKGAVLLK
jgi:hypothetical protein